MDIRVKTHLDALTGLRYLAAFTVLIGHMGGNLPWPKVRIYFGSASALGMPIFFALSGFLMTYNYSAAFRQRFGGTLRSYYVARIARIYPVYLIALALYFSFSGNFFHDANNRPHDTVKSLAYILTLTQSWVHIPVFTDYFHPRTVTLAYMGVAWSVSVEAFFYLVFPLLAIPVARYISSRKRLVIGCSGVFAAYLAFNYAVVASLAPSDFLGQSFGMTRGWWLLYLSPFAHFGTFSTGALLGQYYLNSQVPALSTGDDSQILASTRHSWWAGAGLLSGAAVALLGMNYWFYVLPTIDPTFSPAPSWLRMSASNILYVPLCAIVIYQLASFPCLARRLMGSRLMVQLGEMSYCMYLIHPLVQSFYYQRSIGEGPLTVWYVIVYNNLAMLAVLHFLCLGLYRYVEVPSRNGIRALFSPRKPAPIPAVVAVEIPLLKAA